MCTFSLQRSKINQFHQIYSHKWPQGVTLQSLITIYGATNICCYYDTINEHHVLEILHKCASAMSGSESVPISIFKSIGNETDEGSCKDDCERPAVCSIIPEIRGWLGRKEAPREDRNIPRGSTKTTKKELCEFLSERNISLMDHFCHGEEDRSVLQALFIIDESCEIITLDSLKESKNSRKTNIEVKLGSGKLFDLDKPCNQARLPSSFASSS